MSDKVVEVKNVYKSFGKKKIIKDLSFSVDRGEIYGFLGPNGSGKTTTIRMMVGLIGIDKGDIFIEGYDVKKDKIKALEHVGAIIENPELYKYMSGMQNLIHFARMSKTPVSQERINEIVKLVKLEDAINKKVKTYSLGMKQRLGVAQALLHKPSILILDEPTNGLDPEGIHELREYLRYLAKKENISIIISSHLLSEVELICDNIIVIQEGKLIGERTIKNENNSLEEKLDVEIEVDNIDLAKKLINSIGAIKVEKNRIVINLRRDEIPLIINRLIDGGLKIYEVKQITQSLEEVFLSMTKEGK